MSVAVLRGSVLALPLPDDSVDLVVTSPPYFNLRSYEDGGEHWQGQIGDEPTPAAYLDNLIAATREMMRVVKPSGSIFVNLGDKYATRDSSVRSGGGAGVRGDDTQRARTGRNATGMPEKSLMALPWRYAIRCIDELGLTLREDIVWAKPNGLPESVTDRARRAHEPWFHFTLGPRYYAHMTPLREPHTMRPQRRSGRKADTTNRPGMPPQTWSTAARDEPGVDGHPDGRLPGSVWTIATEPLDVPAHLGVDHHAAFPSEWPRRLIQGWCPEQVCLTCGEGIADDACGCNAPIKTARGSGSGSDPSKRTGRGGIARPRSTNEATTTITRHQQRHEAAQLRASEHRAAMRDEAGASAFAHYERTDLSGARAIPAALRETWLERGWLSAAPSFTRGATATGVVLDPFGGTGTTALVADVLGRHGITVDGSADYCRIAGWRTTDPKQRAKAAREPFSAPAEPTDGQGTLIDLFPREETAS